MSNFKQAISGDRPVVVDFWAEWCMPCRIFSPVLEQLSDELDGKADFYKVNIDENQQLAQEYDIEAIPTVIVFKNGAPLERMVGVVPKEQARVTIVKFI